MQLRNTGNKVTANIESGGAFQIKASGKAFKILTSNLYKDKITAIVRELSCNAWDAHIASGNTDTPFQIHLPNSVEPYFGVKDFGIGMSDEEINSIYTTFFDSTKNTSNDYTGALGLGSKTPFSYTDSFTVISVKDGKKGTYSAFLDEEGCPTIFTMSVEDTDEPSGTEVQVPVAVHDFNEFIRKSEGVFQYFSLQPEVVGVDDATVAAILKPVEYIIKKDEYALRSSQGYEDKYLRAVQGNVAYPIDLRQLNRDYGYSFRSTRLDVYFPMGELDVNAGREDLSYDKLTVANIEKRLNDVTNMISKDIEDELAALPNTWEFIKRAKEIQKSSLSWAMPDLEYNGRSINLSVAKFDRHESAGYMIRHIQKHSHKKNFDTETVGKMYDGMMNMPIDTDTYYYVNDLPGHQAMQRVKNLISLSGMRKGVYILQLEPSYYKVLDQQEIRDCMKLFTDRIDGMQVIYASDLPEVVKVPTEKKARKVPGLLHVDLSNLHWDERRNTLQRRATDLKLDEVDSKAGEKYYVPVNGFRYLDEKKYYGLTLEKLGVICEILGVPKDNVYFPRKRVYNIIKDEADWVNLIDKLDEFAQANIDNMAAFNNRRQGISDITSELPIEYSWLSNEDLPSVFDELIEYVKVYNQQFSEGVQLLTTHLWEFRAQLSEDIELPRDEKLDTILKAIKQRYPILEYVDWSYSMSLEAKLAVLNNTFE